MIRDSYTRDLQDKFPVKKKKNSQYDSMPDRLMSDDDGLDVGQMSKTAEKVLSSMEMISDLLKEEAERLKKLPADERQVDIGTLGGAVMKLGRSTDDLARLIAFAQGRPESNTDHQANILRLLNDKQFEQVCKWAEENERAAKALPVK